MGQPQTDNSIISSGVCLISKSTACVPCLDGGWEVFTVCREEKVDMLEGFPVTAMCVGGGVGGGWMNGQMGRQIGEQMDG